MVPSVRVVPGTVRKVCQLTGEHDRECGEDTTTRTETNYGLFGTDLGSSFEHGGRLWFLFGDTWPCPENHPVSDTDSVAWTTATEASRSLVLTFVSEAGPGGRIRYKSPVLTDSGGVRLRTASFEVPIAGFSAHEQMYIFYSVDAGPEVGGPGGLDALWIGHDGAVVSALANPNIDKARWQPASGLTPPGATRGDSSLACVTRLEGALDVFWIGPDGAVAAAWANPRVDNGNWHPPFPITHPGRVARGDGAPGLPQNGA